MFDKKFAQDRYRMYRMLPGLEAVLSFANPLLLALLLAELLVLAQLLVLAELLVCTTTSRTTSVHFEFLKGVCIK